MSANGGYNYHYAYEESFIHIAEQLERTAEATVETTIATATLTVSATARTASRRAVKAATSTFTLCSASFFASEGIDTVGHFQHCVGVDTVVPCIIAGVSADGTGEIALIL